MFFFCTPVHRSAQACTDVTNYHPLLLSQHFPSPVNISSAVSAWSCGLISFIEHRMLVRDPVHGMQGFWKGNGIGSLPFAPPCENLGRRLSPRVKHFGCLSPKVSEPVASAYECAARIQAMPRVACSCEIAAINECRACLPCLMLVTTIYAALLCASFASELPGAVNCKSSSLHPTPHVPGADLHPALAKTRVQARFWGTRLGLRKRPAGRTRTV